MIGSLLGFTKPEEDQAERRTRSALSRFRQLKDSRRGNVVSEEFIETPRSIVDDVDIRNIEFDPHMHSSLSDGMVMHNALQLVSALGLNGMAFADHHRDELDGVILYNDDAYRILEIEGDDRISANMDVIYEVIKEQQRSFENDEFKSLDGIEQFVEDYNRHHDEQISFHEAAEHLQELRKDSRNSAELFTSIERDYETWNDQKTVDFLEENDFDHVVLSTHYVPEEFVVENPHPKQTQYLRKADVSHLHGLTEHDVEDVFEWYREETKAKLLRAADLTGLSNEEAEELYESHGVEPYRDIEELKKPIAGDTPVIHSHWDLILTSPQLKPYVHEEHIDEYLDLAEELDEIVEVNGRTIMKQRKKYVSSDSFYTPEDAEWFARKVLERAENGDLDYTIASDAHSEAEIIKQYAMLDSVLDDYDAEPLGQEIYSRESEPIVEDKTNEHLEIPY